MFKYIFLLYFYISNMYKYIIYAIIILLTIITIYHIKHYYKYTSLYSISQLDFNYTDYTKEVLDNTFSEKKLTIIILHDDDVIVANKNLFVKDFNTKKAEKRVTLADIYLKEISFMRLAFSSSINYNNNYTISIYNTFTSPIKKQLYDRFFICGIDGTTTIRLFNPVQEKNLYPDYNYKKYENLNDLRSKVIFRDDNTKEIDKQYPLFKNATYIEVILHPGQCLYIPTHWWYSYKNTEDYYNIHLEISSDTYFTHVVKAPRYLNYLIRNTV